ncbi:MAG TPA: hypothetical protein VIT65_28645, partial [Microlunatus sp.]
PRQVQVDEGTAATAPDLGQGLTAYLRFLQQALLDHLAPAHRLNEAQAFLSAATTTGAAAGTAIAGFVIDGWGLTASFGGAAAGAALAAAIALASQSHWRAAAERLATAPSSDSVSGP